MAKVHRAIATLLLVFAVGQLRPIRAQTSLETCVAFRSPERLEAGKSFRALIGLGLELRILPREEPRDGWRISAGPAVDASLDYLSVVSPPLRTAPHLVIGASYGLTLPEALFIERPLRFVVNRDDHTAAVEAQSLADAGAALHRLDLLGRGRITFRITAHGLSSFRPADGPVERSLDYIRFEGNACISLRGR